MGPEEESGDAFAIPDYWRTTDLPIIEDGTTANATGCWILTKPDLDVGPDAQRETDDPSGCFGGLTFEFPALAPVEYISLDDLETLESSTPDLSDDSVDERESLSEVADPIEDACSKPELIPQDDAQLQLKSWEVFNDCQFKESRTELLSERGSIAFDAAVIARGQTINSQSEAKNGRIIHSGPLLMGLYLLGLGRESVLFRYMKADHTFQPRIKDGRMSGYTAESFASLVARFVHHGNQLRQIEDFVDSVYSSTDLVRPLVSVADAFSTILSALQWGFGEKLKTAGGPLQLQSLLREPSLLLSYISEMKELVRAGQSDEDLLSEIYRFLQEMEQTDLGLRQVGFQIISRISERWLRSLGRRLGIHHSLPHESLIQSSNMRGEQKTKSAVSPDLQHDFDRSSIPGFISEEDAKMISSVGQGLELIRSHNPEHPLARPDELSSGNFWGPAWSFTWQEAERIALRAKEYERKISETIRDFYTLNDPSNYRETDRAHFPSSNSNAFASSIEDTRVEFTPSVATIEESFGGSVPGNLGIDPLARTVMDYIRLDHETPKAKSAAFAPSLSLVPVLSFNPILYAQSRLVNHACLRLLFKEHRLRSHLSIQHRFQLLGDGLFATRLSHALFDPELQSRQPRAERSRSGVSGLRLGHRDSWPPATSELRLALMGILTDSFDLPDHGEKWSGHEQEVPGNLNFAIRTISEDELQRCLDPHSIEALDFLRLQYEPPAPLETVITPSCLLKYDAMFKLLLRVIRMLYVVNQFSRMPLHRSSDHHRSNVIHRRFRFEAHHIVTTTCGYFFDGIRTHWSMFLQKLDAIESHLDDFGCGDEHGLEKLRGFHEMLLDRMRYSLLLRQRQKPAMKLLEEIFGYVLAFARLSNSNEPAVGDGTGAASIAQEVEVVYARFANTVRQFVALCREMRETRGLGARGPPAFEEFQREDRAEGRANAMAQLVLRLEMNGYYSQRSP